MELTFLPDLSKKPNSADVKKRFIAEFFIVFPVYRVTVFLPPKHSGALAWTGTADKTIIKISEAVKICFNIFSCFSLLCIYKYYIT